jgi:hypothetical protein
MAFVGVVPQRHEARQLLADTLPVRYNTSTQLEE